MIPPPSNNKPIIDIDTIATINLISLSLLSDCCVTLSILKTVLK